MLRLEGVVLELDGKLVITSIDEEGHYEGYVNYDKIKKEYEESMLDRELKEVGPFYRHFKDKKDLRNWVISSGYRVLISRNYIGIGVGISINGFDFLADGGEIN